MKAGVKVVVFSVVILALSGTAKALEHEPVDVDSPALHCDGSVWAPFCEVSYDRIRRSLWICFACGCEYTYSGVPARRFKEFARSPLKGTFFNRYIRSCFSAQRLLPAERAARARSVRSLAEKASKPG